MPSRPENPVDLVLSIAALVKLGLKGGGGSVRCLIHLCFLSIFLSVGWYLSRDMVEKCAFSTLDCSSGEDVVLLFVVIASCM